MPSVCGDYLRRENREGSRHKIIVSCAIEYLKEAMVRSTTLTKATTATNTKSTAERPATTTVTAGTTATPRPRCFQKSGKKYDYVFGDLTDVPVDSSGGEGDSWEFLRSNF